MAAVVPKEKFIGFVDILGYSALTRAVEVGNGMSFEEFEKLLKLLGSEEDRLHHQKYGATICPGSPCIQKDMDFQITQVWDSVLISAEISPAGVVNLAWHCFGACINLLTKGIMCRGYIKKGMIYHDGNRAFGSGHVDTVAKEKQVSIFKSDADERGTPFIEVNPEVVEYVGNQPDKCVKEMFSRMVVSHEGLTAIFPIKRIAHSFIVGGFGRPQFDPTKEKKNNDVVRRNLKDLKEKVLSFADQSDVSVMRKANHYLRALDEQLKVCDRTDDAIDLMMRPFPNATYNKKDFPGLF